MAQLVPTWHEDRVLPLIVADRAEALFLEHSWSRSCWAQAARCSSSSVGVTDLQSCMLRGPLPELRLPALQYLFLGKNHLSGGLDPLRELMQGAEDPRPQRQHDHWRAGTTPGVHSDAEALMQELALATC